MIREARYEIMAGVIAALGRVMAEVGAILIVGGNSAGYTRVMTTTIALETDKGNFELALALGIILLLISFVINMAFYFIQRKGALQTKMGLTLSISNVYKSYDGKHVLKTVPIHLR